ncbi:MAG: hypothetical protein ACD_40C00009G0003 [uncultured bacterium]|nr:MAG: hypothetical protein ACD_40C00009G0003 [uncultured bacterium]
MQDILEYILKNITTVPDDVKIAVEDLEGTTNYIVTVNPTDVGRIIGKEGKVIKAIRTIMRVIAIQRGVHVRVSIVSENTPLATETTTEETVTPVKEEGLTVEV